MPKVIILTEVNQNKNILKLRESMIFSLLQSAAKNPAWQ
jgi:hypothetical protein